MPSTLLKYFLKRWAWPLLGGVLFFGGLLLANDLIRISRDIFSQGAPISWLLPLMLTTLPETFAMVLPMAAILGGLIGTQQLSEGSELVASQGLGVGFRSILKPWLILSASLVVLASLNAHLVVPTVSSSLGKMQSRMVEEARTRFLKPGSLPYFSPKDPRTGVWVAPDGQIHLFEVNDGEIQHMVAQELSWQREDKGIEEPSVTVYLKNLKGCRYQRSDHGAANNVGLFDQLNQSISIDLPTRPHLLPPTPVRYLSTRALLAESSPDAWIEISRRVTLPFSTIALLLLGIALGLEHPRFRRGGALLKSLAAILAYYLVMKYLETWYLARGKGPILLFAPPVIFFGAGLLTLIWKMRPHHTHRLAAWLRPKPPTKLIESITTISNTTLQAIPSVPFPHPSIHSTKPGILQRWTRQLWWRNWGAAMGTLLTLDLLMEFAPLAGDLSKNGVSYLVFLKYWAWNLPTFLVLAFPVSFLLGGVMAFSDAATSREWVALRAGGGSLLQWIGSGARAWIAVILVTFAVQAVIAPAAVNRADDLYREILARPSRTYQSKPWMNLTSTNVLWFLEKDFRWGFPLRSPGTAPILYRWRRGEGRVDQLPWGGLAFEPGPEASRFFPSEALRRSTSAEDTNTIDLFHWQRWAPDPERATMLWGRLLNWLSGPCLMFAMLAYTFPAPRKGRGQVLGLGLVIGLLFLGLQALFGGAARAGEIPALWGVLAPLLALVGYGFFNLHRLKT